jgi:ATP phosphoribosyltransferase
MVERAQMNKIMDELYAAGARAILVTSIVASRL